MSLSAARPKPARGMRITSDAKRFARLKNPVTDQPSQAVLEGGRLRRARRYVGDAQLLVAIHHELTDHGPVTMKYSAYALAASVTATAGRTAFARRKAAPPKTRPAMSETCSRKPLAAARLSDALSNDESRRPRIQHHHDRQPPVTEATLRGNPADDPEHESRKQNDGKAHQRQFRFGRSNSRRPTRRGPRLRWSMEPGPSTKRGTAFRK